MAPNDAEAGETLALLACSKSKQDGELPAREKYAAPRAQLFKKSRDYAEALGVEYVILSGKYGALAPDDVIDDYNVSVRSRDADAWREDVLDALEERDVDLDEYDEVLVLAGSDYYEPLKEDLADADADISRPLADCAGYGYMIGELSDLLDELEEQRVATDGGRELPGDLADAEVGDELLITADDGKLDRVATTMNGEIDSIDVDEDLFEVELVDVSGEGEREVVSDRICVFAWMEPGGDWQAPSVQYALEPTEDQDVERDQVTSETVAIELVSETSGPKAEVRWTLDIDADGFSEVVFRDVVSAGDDVTTELGVEIPGHVEHGYRELEDPAATISSERETFKVAPREAFTVDLEQETTSVATAATKQAELVPGGAGDVQDDADDGGAELDPDDPDSCHAIVSGGRQCTNGYTSNAADADERLCGTHANASNVSRIDAVDGSPHAELRDELAEAGLSDVHAYYLATLTDDVQDLWHVATGLEDVDVGGKTYEASTLASLADDIANHPDVETGGHPLAEDSCVAVIEEGSYGEDYQCKSGSYSTNLLCGMHSDADDVRTIYDLEDGRYFDRVDGHGTEHLVVELRDDAAIVVDTDSWEVERVARQDVERQLDESESGPWLNCDGCNDVTAEVDLELVSDELLCSDCQDEATDQDDLADESEPETADSEENGLLKESPEIEADMDDDLDGDELDRDAAREEVIEEIAELLERGLSPAQALDYYATRDDEELATHGEYSQSAWSDRRDRSQQAISDSVGKAEDALDNSE